MRISLESNKSRNAASVCVLTVIPVATCHSIQFAGTHDTVRQEDGLYMIVLYCIYSKIRLPMSTEATGALGRCFHCGIVEPAGDALSRIQRMIRQSNIEFASCSLNSFT